jgi:4a-hydroxytetrahydrobiopterin dehydratase
MANPPPVLSGEALDDAVRTLDGWTVRDDALHKAYAFDDFVGAFGFMARCALLAERADHHPDWSNRYRKVDVALTTHASGGITQRDVELARAFDAQA